jgi:hypothetical protein
MVAASRHHTESLDIFERLEIANAEFNKHFRVVICEIFTNIVISCRLTLLPFIPKCLNQYAGYSDTKNGVKENEAAILPKECPAGKIDDPCRRNTAQDDGKRR